MLFPIGNGGYHRYRQAWFVAFDIPTEFDVLLAACGWWRRAPPPVACGADRRWARRIAATLCGTVDITWNNAAKSNAWLHPPGNLAGQAWNYQLRMIDKTLIHVELRSALASPRRSAPGRLLPCRLRPPSSALTDWVTEKLIANKKHFILTFLTRWESPLLAVVSSSIRTCPDFFGFVRNVNL